jgi:hypothetical protein
VATGSSVEIEGRLELPVTLGDEVLYASRFSTQERPAAQIGSRLDAHCAVGRTVDIHSRRQPRMTMASVWGSSKPAMAESKVACEMRLAARPTPLISV